MTLTRNPDVSASGDPSVEVLLREAKRRSRLRRIAIAGVVLVVTALVVTLVVTIAGSSGGRPSRGPGSGGAPGSPALQSGADTSAPGAAARALSLIPSSVQVQLQEVSCGTSSFCMAIGARQPPQSSIGPRADTLAELWTGAAWSVVQVPLNPMDLTGVSCPTIGWCMLVGTQADERLRQFSFAEVYSSGQLTSLTLPPSDQGELSSVSCTSPASCVAVGTHEFADGQPATFAERWDGSAWHVMRTPPGGEYKFLRAVSCASATRCMAVGYNSSGPGPSAERWNGVAWTDLGDLPHVAVPRRTCPPTALGCGAFEPQPDLLGVSCGTPRFCLAYGSEDAGNLVEVWNGRAWHLEGPPSRSVLLSSVSCVAAQQCYGVTARWNTPGPTAVRWTGAAWRSIAATAGTLGHRGTFDSLWCGAPAHCVAVGGILDRDGNATRPFFASWEHARWTVHVVGPVASSWPSRQSRHEDAIRAALAMLGGTPIPAGSTSSSTEPTGDGGRLGSPSRTFDTPVLVDLHQFSVAPGAVANTLGWMSQHPPSGSSLEYANTTPSGERVLAFAWPTSGPLFNDQLLLVDGVSLPGSRTGVRLDAEVVWLPAKPRGDLISGARVVDVRLTTPGSTSVQTAVIRDPRSIANLLRLFNQLAVAPPGRHSCPIGTGLTLRLAFRRHAGAPPFATAIANSTACRDVQVRQFGKWVAPELLGTDFVLYAGHVAGLLPRREET